MTAVSGVGGWSGMRAGEAVAAGEGRTTAAVVAKPDSVKLSAASQIHSLKQGGASTKEIASRMGMTVAQVDEALGITSSSASAKASEVAALLG